MKKTRIAPVKGTRDFYPQDLAFRNWLYAKAQALSLLFGYEEYDGPEIEYIQLYQDKTSDEILKEQVFTLTDRDNRTLVLRPELTPTFARMVTQKSHELLKPIRWFMFGRAWRYEQPQKGRGREFFQWEINIIGSAQVSADAEIIAIAALFLQELGLTSQEVHIRVNDRAYFEEMVTTCGIPASSYSALLHILDRKEKVSEEAFIKLLEQEGLTAQQIQSFLAFLANPSYENSPWLTELFRLLESYPGVKEYVVYDPTIARGLDYYTKTVFEAWDNTGKVKRAIFGGGRFDTLTETLGGENLPGVGMAPGDMPIEALLKDLGKMPTITLPTSKVLIATTDTSVLEYAIRIASVLRQNKIAVQIYLPEGAKLDKQLKYAHQKHIPYVILCGPDEYAKQRVTLKNLATGAQTSQTIEEIVDEII